MRKWIDIVESFSPPTDPEKFERWAWKLKVKGLDRPRPEDIDLIRQVREHARCAEGLGGQCHVVSEWIEKVYGWTTEAGTYCDGDGEPACVFHFWNVLPDGSVLDATADQLAEDDRDIRIISPDDPQHRRYTCEWMEDWYPGHPDYDPTWEREKRDPSKYSGRIDIERKNDLRDERGDYWWADPKHLKAYQEKEARYGEEMD